jgi:hypothetical protein
MRSKRAGQDNLLQHERVTVLRDRRPVGLGRSAVEIVLREGTVLEGLRREEVIGETVLLDEIVRDVPKHLCPYSSNGMLMLLSVYKVPYLVKRTYDTEVLINALVCLWVDGVILSR